jgi:hypothetical protein
MQNKRLGAIAVPRAAPLSLNRNCDSGPGIPVSFALLRFFRKGDGDVEGNGVAVGLRDELAGPGRSDLYGPRCISNQHSLIQKRLINSCC